MAAIFQKALGGPPRSPRAFPYPSRDPDGDPSALFRLSGDFLSGLSEQIPFDDERPHVGARPECPMTNPDHQRRALAIFDEVCDLPEADRFWQPVITSEIAVAASSGGGEPRVSAEIGRSAIRRGEVTRRPNDVNRSSLLGRF